jgi:hypothetical protein
VHHLGLDVAALRFFIAAAVLAPLVPLLARAGLSAVPSGR